MGARPRPEQTTVPNLVGMEISLARQTCEEVELVLLGPDPDGPPLGALTWGRRSVVTSQSPAPGAAAHWGDAVTVTFRRDDGGSRSREPRRPLPGSGELRSVREL